MESESEGSLRSYTQAWTDAKARLPHDVEGERRQVLRNLAVCSSKLSRAQSRLADLELSGDSWGPAHDGLRRELLNQEHAIVVSLQEAIAMLQHTAALLEAADEERRGYFSDHALTRQLARVARRELRVNNA